MKALILNSGMGERLHPLTLLLPKAMMKLGDNVLLGHQIESLKECGIKDLLITTGHFEDKIKQYVSDHHSSINVKYIKNPIYDTTNYIYSMWLTKENIDDDIILLHGDLIFETGLLKRIIKKGSKNCILINRNIKAPKKDFKAIIKDERIIKIGVKLDSQHAFYVAPLYKLERTTFLHWLVRIEEFIEKGFVNIYAEDVFNEYYNEIQLQPVYYDKELCMEIDTLEDLKIAEKLFNQ
tara:strand:- start:1146 stop:1856 length:711 start_codon:yes stop_codon:yes gene_type:complete